MGPQWTGGGSRLEAAGRCRLRSVPCLPQAWLHTEDPWECRRAGGLVRRVLLCEGTEKLRPPAHVLLTGKRGPKGPLQAAGGACPRSPLLEGQLGCCSRGRSFVARKAGDPFVSSDTVAP